MPTKFSSKYAGKSGETTGKKQESAKKAKPSWLKTGDEAQAAYDEAEAKAQAAREESGKLFRFFVPEDEDVTVTFLDGDLKEDGRLDIPMWYEHRVPHGNRWTQFVCISEAEPCPFCEEGDRATLVGGLTVINRTPYTIKNGPNQGTQITNRKQLFVATRQTIKQLQKLAAKRGGLTGTTYECSRTGDKSPRVGDMFQFISQQDADEIKSELLSEGVAEDEVDALLEPADYEDEIVYRTGEELAKMGITLKSAVGSEKNTKSMKDAV